ncbi:hypothetical protein [uncultured Salinisphaera sp.]|uniref:hypothetical protein n=1 Tax=uncultured Salinisphaera sp. TaxID=359372 RepID=UPI0032B226B2|tara:strand:- start:141 stop:1691 length:1551 start_codon:yes stop_codon:yes gene_type:complete
MQKAILWGMVLSAMSLPVYAADAQSQDDMRAELQALKAQLDKLEPLRERVRALEARLAADQPDTGEQTQLAQGDSANTGASDTSAGQTGDGEKATNADNAQDTQVADAGDDEDEDVGTIAGIQFETGAGRPRSREAIKDIVDEVYEDKQSKTVKVGGALRFNATYAEFNDGQKDRGGDIGLDTFRINVDADIDDLLFSAEYRFYNTWRALHHGWVGYQFTDDQHIEVGLTRVPFGILPYASNNFYFSSNYYTGFEDDYDIGAKYVATPGQWDFQAAFFKNSEGNGNDRYSVDPIGIKPQINDENGNPIPATQAPGGLARNNFVDGYAQSVQETNTTNLRAAYNWKHAEDYVSEIGISGQYGFIYNNATTEYYGDNIAGALHLHGNYGPWEVMLEAARYEYDLDGNEDVLGTGYFNTNYVIPTEATSWLGNVSYTFQLDLGPFDSLEVYNDYTYIGNKSGALPNTWQNVTGAALAAGNLYTYFDLIQGKNETFVNGTLVGDRPKTQTLFNINMGYYF